MIHRLKILVLSCVAVFLSCYAQAQTIAAYKAEDIMERVAAHPDTFYVVNFWATWCGPCIKELPEFDALADKYKDQPVKVILVSLDFKKDYPEKIEKFIKKKNLTHEVVWLNETKANEFIPKIADEWQGSIPATMLYFKKRSYKKFFEGIIKSHQLTTLIDKQLSVRY